MDYLAQAVQEDGVLVTPSGNVIRVYQRGTPGFEDAIVHRFPNGISEVTQFVVEPGNEIDLLGLTELLAEKKISFGLKSGGHISIPKIYPPDEGILISMRRFNKIQYDKEKKTLDVGAGVIWKDVYEYLKSFESDHAPGVVGGDPVTGVSGWLLGGGYSLQTNRFGLGSDNIVGFRVLLPVAKAVYDVSSEVFPEIFKVLKGGGHNFGIVTQFTLRVHDHAKRTKPVMSRECSESDSSIVKDSLIRFIENETPPGAVVVASFRHDLKDGELKSFIPWYEWRTDGSSWLPVSDGHSENNPPSRSSPGNVSASRELARFFISGGSRTSGSDEGQSFHSQSQYTQTQDTPTQDTPTQDAQSMSLAEAYEAFSLRHLPVSLETLQTDSHFVQLDASLEIEENTLNDGDLIERKLFASLQKGNKIDRKFIASFMAGKRRVVMESPPDLRGRMACIMVSTYTRGLIDEAEKQAKALSRLMKAHQGVRASFEIWPFHKDAFNGVRREDSAWPHEEGSVFGPLVGWFEWSGKDNDEFWLKAIAEALAELRKVALEEKCTTEDLPMYLNITLESTLVKDIYRDHYEELKRLRRKYDPDNVMGLAAGFVINTNEV